MAMNIDQNKIGQKVLMHFLKDPHSFQNYLGLVINHWLSPQDCFSCISPVPLLLICYNQWLNDFPVAITSTHLFNQTFQKVDAYLALLSPKNRWENWDHLLLVLVSSSMSVCMCVYEREVGGMCNESLIRVTELDQTHYLCVSQQRLFTLSMRPGGTRR